MLRCDLLLFTIEIHGLLYTETKTQELFQVESEWN